MTQHHVSIIDWAFRVCIANEKHQATCRCRIGKIRPHGTDKVIDPKVFIKKKSDSRKTGVWS